MKYGILLWPHANARYQQAERSLSVAELRLVMGEGGLLGEPSFETIAGADFLVFDSPLSGDLVAARVQFSAHILLLSEIRPDGSLLPICSQREAYLGADLAGILKYKGKTNEVFTRFLINLAVYSSAFSKKAGDRLRLLDPMCGRGTALFEAVNRGYDAVGSDVDRQDIREAVTFFKRYLEYHKCKHISKELSMTLPGKRQLQRRQFTFSATVEGYRAGDVRELSLIQGDAEDVVRAFPEKHFHIMTLDLPYGVQHTSGNQARPEPLDRLLARVLPILHSRLMPGGAVSLSYNVNTISKASVDDALTKARLTVCTGPAYDGLAHWVEQAVTRDASVAVRR